MVQRSREKLAAWGVWFVSGGDAEQGMCDRELVLIWTGGGHRDLDAPHTHPHQRAAFQQLQADRPTGRGGELGMDRGHDIERAG